MKKVIVIPCYNESERLKFDDFAQFLHRQDEYQLCFVNDGSKDDTLDLLRGFKARMGSQVLIYDMPTNKGKAEAVRAGVNHVLQLEGVEQIGFMDADLSTTTIDYMRLSDEIKVGGKEMVFGSRKMNSDQEIDRNPIRLLLSAIVGLLIRMILRLPIKDTQCGAKVFSTDAARIAFSKTFLTRWLFDVEIFIRMTKSYGRRLVMEKLLEKELLQWEDVDGSKLSLYDSVKIPAMLLKISYEYSLKPLATRAALIFVVSQWYTS